MSVRDGDSPPVDFDREPATYRHWELAVDGPVATLTMRVDPVGGPRDEYSLKLNSYDLDVDIELHDAAQRLRFEHPGVKAVVVQSGLDKVFCAGANIQMLATSSHHHKVNFCKFTNETRNGIEDATEHSRQTWIAAVEGTAAGGGYELAMACDEIVLVDDRSTAVSLPEVPLLAVLPGTGGLTRLTDKRHVRRDLADVFATRTEGIKGQQAVDWGLVDAIAPRTRFAEVIAERAAARAAESDRPEGGPGVHLFPLERTTTDDGWRSPNVEIRIDRALGAAHIIVQAPSIDQPTSGDELITAGAHGWALAVCRELDDAILRLRFAEPDVGTWVLETHGDPGAVIAVDDTLREHCNHWLAREIRLFWARTLKRLDVSSRTLVASITPGSCFAGTLAELALAADRSFMLEGRREDDEQPPAVIRITDVNDGWYPMVNGLSRFESRCWGRNEALDTARAALGKELDAVEAVEAGIVTFALDDIDWDDELRLALEERNSFSPDALTGMEANLRFPGPETMESKIFARLSAWQNWVFQRPNAVGPEGALRRFGSGSRPTYDRDRV